MVVGLVRVTIRFEIIYSTVIVLIVEYAVFSRYNIDHNNSIIVVSNRTVVLYVCMVITYIAEYGSTG